jgi:predicted transcriptional regulator
MDNNKPNFLDILKKVKETQRSEKTFPFIATEYLGYARRGTRVNYTIKELLEQHDVFCEPDFGTAWFYGEIEIKPKLKVGAGKSNVNYEDTDPTPRLNLLNAANLNEAKLKGIGQGLISVNRDTPLNEATTLMMLYNFSQLPILSGTRQVEGIISWRSIGRQQSLNIECRTVSDCKDEVEILNYDTPLFSAVKVVLEKEVVLVRQKDGTISGIVTITDIGEQFISMAEPFLMVEQIENHIRKLLDKKLSKEELNSFFSNIGNKQEIDSLSDLTFGDYVRILEDPKKFDKIGLNVDRVLLTKQLEEVRIIRNEIMHFDPVSISAESLNKLRQTASFLHTITTTLKRKKIV